MRSSLDELITELDDLKTFIESGSVKHTVAGHKNTMELKYISIRKRFDYAAFSVVLYSSFEKFVENLIKAYIQLETRRVDYASLPQKLTSKHLTESAELLRRRRLGEGRFVGMSELSVVKNLFDCLNGNNPYALNEAAVIAHDMNLRSSEVDTIFGVIGINNICDSVCHSDEMNSWYCNVQALNKPQKGGVQRLVIEERLKEIVERRNQVAHHGNPINLPSVEDMSDAVTFIKSLAMSIFGFVAGHFLQNHHVMSTSNTKLTLHAGDAPIKNQMIVIVNKPAHKIFVGQPVFVIVQSTGARWGRIQSLQVDNVDIQEVEEYTNAPNGVGVGLSFKCPKNTDVKLFALQTEDDVLWSPL